MPSEAFDAVVDAPDQAGDEAATAAAPRIRELLKRERWASIFRKRPTKRAAEVYLSSSHMNLCLE